MAVTVTPRKHAGSRVADDPAHHRFLGVAGSRQHENETGCRQLPDDAPEPLMPSWNPPFREEMRSYCHGDRDVGRRDGVRAFGITDSAHCQWAFGSW